MADNTDAYQEGLRDGKIDALERTTQKHSERLDNHDVRLTAQERIVYAVGLAFLFLQALPIIKEWLQ